MRHAEIVDDLAHEVILLRLARFELKSGCKSQGLSHSESRKEHVILLHVAGILLESFFVHR